MKTINSSKYIPRNRSINTKAKPNHLHALFAGAVLCFSFIPVLAQPAGVVEAPEVKVIVTKTSDEPQALVIAIRGNCEFSNNGAGFAELKKGQVLNQGDVIRTSDGSRADLFFRRIGTTARLQPGTEVTLEKMERHMKDGIPLMDTLVSIRTGRIFIVVRSMVSGSTFEIRNAAGRSVVEGGGGTGRYIITADGTHVTDKNSSIPLKLILETGITVISPGQKFNAKEGKQLAQSPSEAVETLIDLDELDSLADKMSLPATTPEAK